MLFTGSSPTGERGSWNAFLKKAGLGNIVDVSGDIPSRGSGERSWTDDDDDCGNGKGWTVSLRYSV